MKTDYRPFVVDEMSFNVVTSVAFIVIVVVVVSTLVVLVKKIGIGTKKAAVIVTPIMI
jgi:hypothetical protein